MTSAGIREPGRSTLPGTGRCSGGGGCSSVDTLLRTGAARGICEDYYYSILQLKEVVYLISCAAADGSRYGHLFHAAVGSGAYSSASKSHV